MFTGPSAPSGKECQQRSILLKNEVLIANKLKLDFESMKLK